MFVCSSVDAESIGSINCSFIYLMITNYFLEGLALCSHPNSFFSIVFVPLACCIPCPAAVLHQEFDNGDSRV
jgi:hypothetical protein